VFKMWEKITGSYKFVTKLTFITVNEQEGCSHAILHNMPTHDNIPFIVILVRSVIYKGRIRYEPCQSSDC